MKDRSLAVWLLALLVAAAADGLLFYFLLGAGASYGYSSRGRYPKEEPRSVSEDSTEQLKDTHTADSPDNSGWLTGEGCYYFTGDGYCYFIGEKTENYIKGRVEIDEYEAEQLVGSEGEELLAAVEDAAYFYIRFDVEQERYFGRVRNGGSYKLYMAIGGDEAYIYDSGWGVAERAERVELPLLASLEDYFSEEALAEAKPWGPAGDPAVFAKEGIDFDSVKSRKASWNAVQIGRYVVVKQGGGDMNSLYLCSAAGNKEPELLLLPEEGWSVSLLGTDGEALIYGMSRSDDVSGSTVQLYRLDLKKGEPELILDDKLKDFIVYKGNIYYTDYVYIKCLDAQGRVSTLWDDNVYSFVPCEGYIYVYNGDRWELIDAEDGEDLGYMSADLSYAYECDASVYVDEYLYFTAFDYERESISLRAMNVWTGEERIVGGEHAAGKSDTYNVLFLDGYCYYTADGGERLVRVDVTEGSESERALNDAGYYYATELLSIDGEAIMHAYDRDGGEHYLELGEELQMTERGGLIPRS